MTHGSLFSGIGGFDLAAEWMGWDNKFHCEWNPFGQRILKHYWPEAESFDDITKTDFTKYYGAIDIISGGFPCQPYSNAGERKGKEDERHLWPEMLRTIREIAPSWVLGENVRGLTNWNGGVVFDEICSDLENIGYQVAPVIIPACSVNAPHKRERVWFVAYRNGTPTKYTIPTRGNLSASKSSNGNASDTDSFRQFECEREHEEYSNEGREYALYDSNSNDEPKSVTDTDSSPSQCGNSQTKQERKESSRRIESLGKHPGWEVFPTQSPICGGDDGLPTQLDGITFPKWRTESIKGYGNAIVPQVAFEIFKVIQQYELLHNA